MFIIAATPTPSITALVIPATPPRIQIIQSSGAAPKPIRASDSSTAAARMTTFGLRFARKMPANGDATMPVM